MACRAHGYCRLMLTAVKISPNLIGVPQNNDAHLSRCFCHCTRSGRLLLGGMQWTWHVLPQGPYRTSGKCCLQTVVPCLQRLQSRTIRSIDLKGRQNMRDRFLLRHNPSQFRNLACYEEDGLVTSCCFLVSKFLLRRVLEDCWRGTV